MKGKMMKLMVLGKMKVADLLNNERGDFGIGAILSIVIALIIAGFIFIPQMRTLAGNIMTDISSWWTNTISPTIFPTT